MKEHTDYCSHCRRGDIFDREAYALYTGYEYTPYVAAGLPFRAFLCEDHATMIGDDGGTISFVRLVNAESL